MKSVEEVQRKLDRYVTQSVWDCYMYVGVTSSVPIDHTFTFKDFLRFGQFPEITLCL